MKTRARKHQRNQGPETALTITRSDGTTTTLFYEGHVNSGLVPTATLKKYGGDQAQVSVRWFVDGQETTKV